MSLFVLISNEVDGCSLSNVDIGNLIVLDHRLIKLAARKKFDDLRKYEHLLIHNFAVFNLQSYQLISNQKLTIINVD